VANCQYLPNAFAGVTAGPPERVNLNLCHCQYLPNAQGRLRPLNRFLGTW